MRVVFTYRHQGSQEYLDLITIAQESAARFGYRSVLVGDNIPYELANDHIGSKTANDEPLLMNWILAAQLAFIESPLFDQPSVIFSPDALVIKPLEPIFEQDFDVAFTDRDNRRWPINNGVIFLHPARKDLIREFWLACIHSFH